MCGAYMHHHVISLFSVAFISTVFHRAMVGLWWYFETKFVIKPGNT